MKQEGQVVHQCFVWLWFLREGPWRWGRHESRQPASIFNHMQRAQGYYRWSWLSSWLCPLKFQQSDMPTGSSCLCGLSWRDLPSICTLPLVDATYGRTLKRSCPFCCLLSLSGSYVLLRYSILEPTSSGIQKKTEDQQHFRFSRWLFHLLNVSVTECLWFFRCFIDHFFKIFF